MRRTIWLSAAACLGLLTACGKSSDDVLASNILASIANSNIGMQNNSDTPATDIFDDNTLNASDQLNQDMSDSANESVGIAAVQGVIDGTNADPNGGSSDTSSSPHD